MESTRIEAGQLNQEIALETDVGDEFDGHGQHVEDWQPWGTPASRWCAVEQLSGREIERANMLNVEATHRITMYWVPGLTAVKMRGKIGSRIFNFGIVNNVLEANVKAVITACERIA